MSDTRLWHGGVPGLHVGDLIRPGHERKHHDGCPWCEARATQAAGGPAPVLDPLAKHVDRVYVTSDREYARFYASLWGYGDLYRVEPVGDLQPSDEDTMPAWHCPRARVIGVYERAVLLTNGQRRRIHRAWARADAAKAANR